MTRSDPQFTDAEKPPARKRTSDERQRKDRYSVASRWAGLRARSREGKFLKAVRADLVRHVGGVPNTVSDSATTAGASLANQIATLTRVVGACAIDQPCLNSVVGVPGTGRTLSVSYV